jgi:outer membrane receptor protein involved in Fe transport
MKLLSPKIFCFLFGIFFQFTSLHAQSVGTLRGRVLDQTQALLPGVTVELSYGEGQSRTVLATENGTYTFEGVQVGRAEVTFKLINFSTIRRSTVVEPGVTTLSDVVLYVSSNADITVTAPLTFRNLADLDRPAENLVGVAASSSEGAITSAQLEHRPMMRPGEVLETVPGVIVSQHSGEGKANQYYLRGFNLDHGTDFATTIAGIPVNNPTHGHGHGYSDANFLIPELVSGLQFRKGPYFVEESDFSAAGAANINYFNRLERPIIDVSWGAGERGRFLGAASPRVGSGYLLGAVEFDHNNGPWVQPEHLHTVNGILRYTQGDALRGFSITGMGYSSDWNATDQVAQRAVTSGLIPRFGNLDATDNGRTYRYSVAGDAQWSGSRDTTRVTAYVQRYGLNLIQNFTYFLDDPIDGDQFEQEDRRWVTGGQITHRRLGTMGAYNLQSAFGAEVRHDAIGNVGLYRTVAGRRTATVREDTIGQTSLGAFGQTEIEWSKRLRTTVGLRGDVYRYNVESDNPLNSGTRSAGILSPKAGAVIGPWSGTEFYINAGLGFHSNDGRGVTITVDPLTGDPADRVTPLVRARGAEFGVRTVAIRGLQSTVSWWVLGFDSELLFVGDAGTTEAGRPSRRSGIEITNYAHPHPWVTLDLDLSFSRAKFTDRDPAGNKIPGALDRVISGGFAVAPPEGGAGVIASLRLRHFGPRPLIEDNSVKSESTSLVNGELGYRFNERYRLVGEIFNLFDSEVSDIDYYYTSRLPGEPDRGVDDIHTHPALPRSLRIGLQIRF